MHDALTRTILLYLLMASSLYGSDPPFGEFSTPLNGSTVSGAISVTGWALDDVGVESVKIYRDTGSLSYIGDAVFVEGSRPDVAAAYPSYPNNTSAGWGYELMTHLLPDGSLTLVAKAKDTEGQEVTLGTKTVTVDNANAVKPFGSIDTPAQGGTASGSSYLINGWALTPQPNAIPADGSTITLYIDGNPIGNPAYNIYREDIATLFPGYANSNGSGFYMDINTTLYTNGVHTIYAVVTDNAGNTDGIGSRYFSIQNDESLPVELRFLSAEVKGSDVRIYWVTESETENAGFILERHEGALQILPEQWERIASYELHHDLCGQGNTSERHEYSYVDTNTEPAQTYAYRLSDVNFSGDLHICDVIEITLPELPAETMLKPPFPNPFNPKTQIKYQLSESGPVNIAVYDVLGKKVRTLISQNQSAGSYHVYWHGENAAGQKVATGIYVIVLKANEGVSAQTVLMKK